VITRTNALLASRATVARSLISRMIGLMGRRELAAGEALVIPSCRSIHTYLMRFAIDAVFVDRTFRVVALRRVPPWRITPIIWRAWAVIELPVGTSERHQVQVGDQLLLLPS